MPHHITAIVLHTGPTGTLLASAVASDSYGWSKPVTATINEREPGQRLDGLDKDLEDRLLVAMDAGHIAGTLKRAGVPPNFKGILDLKTLLIVNLVPLGLIEPNLEEACMFFGLQPPRRPEASSEALCTLRVASKILRAGYFDRNVRWRIYALRYKNLKWLQQGGGRR